MPLPAIWLKRALIAGVAALALLVAPAPASAEKPCWKQVLEEWADNGEIRGRYPISCYDDALRNMGSDLEHYSSAADVIEAARQRALSRSPAGRGGSDERVALPPSGGRDGEGGGGDGDGPIGHLLNAGPGSVPLPLLALASVALLLLAAAGAGLVSRYRQGRRGEPAAEPDAGTGR